MDMCYLVIGRLSIGLKDFVFVFDLRKEVIFIFGRKIWGKKLSLNVFFFFSVFVRDMRVEKGED